MLGPCGMGTLPPMNQTIFHGIPFDSGYPLPTEQQCLDEARANAQHPVFADGGVTDYIRNHQHHGSFAHGAAAASMPPSADVRYMAHHPTMQMHMSHCQTHASSIALTPRTSSNWPISISSSAPAPISPFTPLTTAFHANLTAPVHYSTAPSEVFPSPSTFPVQQYTMSHMGSRMPSISTDYPGSGISRAQTELMSPSTAANGRDNYASPVLQPNGYQFSPPSHPDYAARPPHNSMGEQPRSILSPTISASPTSASSHRNTATVLGPEYSSHERSRDDQSPPFPHLQIFHELVSDGETVVPDIHAKVEKGFFAVDQTWTCYRRNYFSVRCSYSLRPHLPKARLYLNRGRRGGHEQVQAFAVSLSAAVDQGDGKPIELVQHTPKRDKGPLSQVKLEKLAPKPPGTSAPYNGTPSIASPYLPLQSDHEPAYAGPDAVFTHTFERIQFKQATANNGKRRAQQQYYHLVVELYADVRNIRDPLPNWVKVAQRISVQVVVRGRSPGHYVDEKSSNSSSSGSGGSGAPGSGFHGYRLHGGPGSGSRSGGGGLGIMSSSAINALGYQAQQYSSGPSPPHSHSMSCSSSASGGHLDHPMETADRGAAMIEEHPGYQYYPSPLYDTGSPPLGHSSAGHVAANQDEGLPRDATRPHEYYNHNFTSIGADAAVRNLHSQTWYVGGCGRFQGTDTSRGYYPDLRAGY